CQRSSYWPHLTF
nr:immunoglobulin light chain junction region [Macaca mulatta]